MLFAGYSAFFISICMYEMLICGNADIFLVCHYTKSCDSRLTRTQERRWRSIKKGGWKIEDMKVKELPVRYHH